LYRESLNISDIYSMNVDFDDIYRIKHHPRENLAQGSTFLENISCFPFTPKLG